MRETSKNFNYSNFRIVFTQPCNSTTQKIEIQIESVRKSITDIDRQ